MTKESRDAMFMALRRLATWRTFFAARHVMQDDPEFRLFLDDYEKWLMLRVETSSISAILLAKGIVSPEEFHGEMVEQADALSRSLSRAFPGIVATDDGLHWGDLSTYTKEVRLKKERE